MSISSGGSIPTNGLVFLYDQDNVTKSWNGKPTTNVHPETVGGMQGITYTYVGVEDGWKKYSISGTWSAGTYPYSCYLSGSSFSAGVRYSVAATMKTNVPHKFNGNFTYINYVNAPKDDEGSGGYNILEDGSHRPFRKGFAYTSTTNQTGYLDSRPTANGTSFNSSTDFFYIKDIQAEVGEFPTPYVDATRSTTQAIKDISGTGEVVTVGNLSYHTTLGTFDFDGTDDSFSIAEPNITKNPNQFTISAWIFPGNQNSFFITPYSHGIDQFIEYSNSTASISVRVASGADTNERGRNSGANTVPLNTWTHFSVSIANRTIKIYINGVLKQTYNETINIANWEGVWYIGQRGNSSYWYDGKLDQLSIHNRPLTAAEVTQTFEAKRGRFGI